MWILNRLKLDREYGFIRGVNLRRTVADISRLGTPFWMLWF